MNSLEGSSEGRAGRPRERGRGLGQRCPAWKPPLQPVGHRGQHLASEPPGRRGSGSRVDLKGWVSRFRTTPPPCGRWTHPRDGEVYAEVPAAHQAEAPG